MTSSARALASRQNGARSRGPRTAAGKARTAHNALKHGLSARRMALLDDESAADFAEFDAAVRAELAPVARARSRRWCATAARCSPSCAAPSPRSRRSRPRRPAPG